MNEITSSSSGCASLSIVRPVVSISYHWTENW